MTMEALAEFWARMGVAVPHNAVPEKALMAIDYMMSFF